MTQAQIRTIVGELDDFSGLVTRSLAFEINANVIENTPRDTSWAAANWIPTVGTQNNTPAPRSDNPNIGSARARQAAGIAQVLSYKLPQGAIFVTNNVPYIVDLNGGSSAQAPAGFVEAAIDAAISKVRRQAVLR